MPHDDIYCEKIYTMKENDEQSEEQDPCVEVVNYLTYDESHLYAGLHLHKHAPFLSENR